MPKLCNCGMFGQPHQPSMHPATNTNQDAERQQSASDVERVKKRRCFLEEYLSIDIVEEMWPKALSHAFDAGWQARASQEPRPLLEAMQVIAEALKEPDGGSYWPARQYLDKYDKFHEDLDGTRVLLQVAELALKLAGGINAKPIS